MERETAATKGTGTEYMQKRVVVGNSPLLKVVRVGSLFWRICSSRLLSSFTSSSSS